MWVPGHILAHGCQVDQETGVAGREGARHAADPFDGARTGMAGWEVEGLSREGWLITYQGKGG